MGRLPCIVSLFEGYGFGAGFIRDFRQIVQGFLFGAKTGLGAGEAANLAEFIVLVANSFYSDPPFVWKLVNAALPVPAVLRVLLRLLPDPARRTKLAPVRNFRTAFSAFHIVFSSYFC